MMANTVQQTDGLDCPPDEPHSSESIRSVFERISESTITVVIPQTQFTIELRN